MATSLAPSPMASVMALAHCLTISTTSAFCSGEHRQQITTRQEVDSAMKASRFSACNAFRNDCTRSGRRVENAPLPR